MFRRIFCIYFPNCVDEDECLYEHEKSTAEEVNICSKGKECNDQSCTFSEKQHSNARPSCKFQAGCNRLNCAYKHSFSRKSFLEVGSLNRKRK